MNWKSTTSVIAFLYGRRWTRSSLISTSRHPRGIGLGSEERDGQGLGLVVDEQHAVEQQGHHLFAAEPFRVAERSVGARSAEQQQETRHRRGGAAQLVAVGFDQVTERGEEPLADIRHPHGRL